MAGETFYGTTLTDLQGGRTAQARMDAERQQLGTRLFAQAASSMADRLAAQQRAEQDRAYQMFGLAQQDRNAALDRALKAQQLQDTAKAEEARLQAERDRIQAILEAERIRNEGIKIQFPQGKTDPRIADEILKQNGAANQTNTIADAAAREANALLMETLKIAQSESDTAAPDTGFFTPWRPNATEAGKLRADKYRDSVSKGVDAIRLKLGDKAQYLTFNGKFFEPIKMPITQFPGVQQPPAAAVIAPEVVAPVILDPDPEANAFPGVNRVFPPSAPAAPTSRFIWSPNSGLRPLR